MLTGYRVIGIICTMNIELSKFVPISGKVKFFCTKKVCLKKQESGF